MIIEMRQFIREQVLKVDPDLIENQSAFYDGDVGETTLENTFQISINNIVSNERTDFRHNEIEVILTIFGFGYQDEIVAYDSLLDKAICMRDYIIAIENFSGISNITDIVSNGIVSEQLPGDNNGFKIDINLTVREAYL